MSMMCSQGYLELEIAVFLCCGRRRVPVRLTWSLTGLGRRRNRIFSNILHSSSLLSQSTITKGRMGTLLCERKMKLKPLVQRSRKAYIRAKFRLCRSLAMALFRVRVETFYDRCVCCMYMWMGI
jgi:hypothetical protein